MFVTLSTDITALYDVAGYGCSVVPLKAGFQEVDDTFGAFLIENYNGVVQSPAPASPVPATAASDLQDQIDALTAQVASLTPTPVTSTVDPNVTPVVDPTDTPDSIAGQVITDTPDSTETPVDPSLAN